MTPQMTRNPHRGTERLLVGRAFLWFCGIAVVLWCAGCGKHSSDGAAATKPLRVWHWMTDREDPFNELAARYKREHDLPVRFELYAPSDLYAQKVRAAAQTNGLPDIFGVLGEMRDFASFIQAGHVMDLSAEMETQDAAWEHTFFPVALALNRFAKRNSYGVKPGIYGVPIDVMSIQVYYNKSLLKKLGFDPEHPPQTWDEFLAVGKPAREQHLLGFVSGWAELWLIDCFATDYAIHLMGLKKVEATFRGEVPYTDPDWVKVLGVFEQLRASNLLAEGVVTMVNKRAEQLFANGQAVFAFNGTWGVNVYHSMAPTLDYGVMMLPVIRKDRPMVTWGGAGSSFMVNAKSPKRQEAIEFLKWLTADPQQQYLLDTTNNIPANQHVAANLPPALAAFADDMDAVVHPRLFDVQERPAVIEAFDKGIQSILIGEENPLQVAQEVQDMKQREEVRHAALHDRDHEATHVTP